MPLNTEQDMRKQYFTGYSRLGGSMAGLSSGMYPGSYPSSDQNPYPSISMENPASAAYFGSLVSDALLLLILICIHCASCLGSSHSNLFIEFISAIKVGRSVHQPQYPDIQQHTTHCKQITEI